MRALLMSTLLIGALSGCTSIQSQMWSRAEDDQLYPDTDKPIHGVPVMLKVPSHIEITIKEKLYASHKQGANAGDGAIQVVTLRRPDLSVDAQLEYTEKMFVVDPVRVASGTGLYGFGFAAPEKASPIKDSNGDGSSGHGYLHTLSYKAEDTTIVKGATLLQSILSLNSPASAQQKSFQAGFGLIEIERVVAFRRFDLGSPTVDEEIQGFLEQKMNCCHRCCLNGLQQDATSEEAPAPAPATDGQSPSTDK